MARPLSGAGAHGSSSSGRRVAGRGAEAAGRGAGPDCGIPGDGVPVTSSASGAGLSGDGEAGVAGGAQRSSAGGRLVAGVRIGCAGGGTSCGGRAHTVWPRSADSSRFPVSGSDEGLVIRSPCSRGRASGSDEGLDIRSSSWRGHVSGSRDGVASRVLCSGTPMVRALRSRGGASGSRDEAAACEPPARAEGPEGEDWSRGGAAGRAGGGGAAWLGRGVGGGGGAGAFTGRAAGGGGGISPAGRGMRVAGETGSTGPVKRLRSEDSAAPEGVPREGCEGRAGMSGPVERVDADRGAGGLVRVSLTGRAGAGPVGSPAAASVVAAEVRSVEGPAAAEVRSAGVSGVAAG